MVSIEALIRAARLNVTNLENEADRLAAETSRNAQSLEKERIRLAAFEEAAQAIGSVAPGQAAQAPARERGRPIGSFSPEWTKVLIKISEAGRADYPKVFEFADEVGIKSGRDAVRDRIREYLKSGLLVGDAAKGFSVDQAKAESRGILQGRKGSPEGEAEGVGKPSAKVQ
jgi:hypothetical protein